MKNDTPIPANKRFLRFRQVRERLPMARSTWDDGVRKGTYPPAYYIGPGMTAWLESDVDEIVAQIKRGEVPHWPPHVVAA